MKDAKALEKAFIGKLEAQRDFAAQYVALFPHGVRADFRSDSTVRSGDDWCLTFAIHVRNVRRWCALLDRAKYVERKNAIFKRCWTLAEMGQAANFSSESVEWFTPARYIEATREVLGEIDLDPASSAQANALPGATERVIGARSTAWFGGGERHGKWGWMFCGGVFRDGYRGIFVTATGVFFVTAAAAIAGHGWRLQCLVPIARRMNAATMVAWRSKSRANIMG